MVNKFTAFRGLFDGNSWGNSFTEGFIDPTKSRRLKAATSLAEGEAAFQPLDQGLKLGKFDQDTEALRLQSGRLGLDKDKFGYQKMDDERQLVDRQVGRQHESKLVRDRAIAGFSPYSIAALDQGTSPMSALQLGSGMRIKQAGSEAGARAGAAASVKRRYDISGGALKRASEMVMEARAAGQQLDPKEAVRLAQQEIGETIYGGKSKNLLPLEQRVGDDRRKLGLEIIKKMSLDGMSNPEEIREKLVQTIGEAGANELLGGLQGGGQPAPVAQDPDEDEAANLQGIYEAGVAEYGQDPNQWPAEFRALPAVQEALSRLQQ